MRVPSSNLVLMSFPVAPLGLPRAMPRVLIPSLARALIFAVRAAANPPRAPTQAIYGDHRTRLGSACPQERCSRCCLLRTHSSLRSRFVHDVEAQAGRCRRRLWSLHRAGRAAYGQRQAAGGRQSAFKPAPTCRVHQPCAGSGARIAGSFAACFARAPSADFGARAARPRGASKKARRRAGAHYQSRCT